MKTLSLARYAFGLAGGIAFLAGCSGQIDAPSQDTGLASPSSVHGQHGIQDLNRMFAMTNVMHRGIPAGQHPLTHSWLDKAPKGTKGTLWATDMEYGSVDVIAYPSGTLTGQISGFSYPYGDCSDKYGNVYVADFNAQTGYEIKAGTTKVIDSWPTGGEAIGCSVSKSGDVAFTNFDPGGVVVFPGGGASGTTYPGPAYDWAAGYDKNGSLFVECDYAAPCSGPHLAELVSGRWQLLSYDQAINFPGSVQGGGPDIGVADQAAGGQFETAIYWTSVSGSSAHNAKTYLMEGTGCSLYMDDSGSWGSIVKKHADGVQSHTVKGAAAPDIDCFPSPINIYGKKGGNPIRQMSVSDYEYDYGVTFTEP